MSEQYENIINLESEPSHYEMRPSILNFLTYIDSHQDEQGNQIFYRKRLKPIHIEVYMALKRLAGKQVCMRTTEYISRLAGCSPTSVVDAKKVLSQSFEQLDGKPLIEISEKYTATRDEDKTINKKPVHLINIKNIWPWNNLYMQEVDSSRADSDLRIPPEMKVVISKEDAEIAIEKMAQPSKSDYVHNSGGHSKNGTSLEAHSKNGTSPLGGSFQKWNGHYTPKQDPIVKTQNPTEQLSQSVSESFLNAFDINDCFSCEAKTLDWLTGFGINRAAIKRIMANHHLDELKATTEYMRKIMRKKPIKGSLQGYFLKTLENKWWMPTLK